MKNSQEFLFCKEEKPKSIFRNQQSILLKHKSIFKKTKNYLSGLEKCDLDFDFQKRFIITISQWVKMNPGTSINIWIDRAMATPESIENFKKAVTDALGEKSSTIHFRDVRSIELVKLNPRAFDDKINVYARVDLFRAMMADHILRKKESKFFVYADIDMKPLSRREIFDQRTIDSLQDDGIVLSKHDRLRFENGFQILNGNHKKLLEEHQKEIINSSIYEMTSTRPDNVFAEVVYQMYQNLKSIAVKPEL